ncbi:MAG: hypothetical protein QW056_06490 [Candidatus Bathyarchaeia archaeon]
MNKFGKKKCGSMKVVCGVLIALLVIFAFFTTYLYIQKETLEDQVAVLKSQVSSLEFEKNNLNVIIENLESQRADLWNELESLRGEVRSLQDAKSSLEAQVSDLRKENELLRSQTEPLREIVNMQKSDRLVNETLVFVPNAQKTWGTFNVNYCGMLLVRVQMIPEPGFADVPIITIGVDLSSKLYINRQGTLNLTPGAGEYYYTSTALFPIADLTFPISFSVTVRNNSPYTIRLSVTITFVY